MPCQRLSHPMAARPRTTRKALNAEKPEKEKAKAREHDAGEVAPSSPLVPEHSKRPRLEVEASAVTTTSPSPLSVVRLNVGGARFETTYALLIVGLPPASPRAYPRIQAHDVDVDEGQLL